MASTKKSGMAKNRSETGPPAQRREPASPRGEEILNDLEELFLREGFRDLTIGELARRMRCSRRTLYSLAESKEELFLRVVDRWLRRIRQMGREGAFSHTDPVVRIEAYLDPGVTETRLASGRFSEDIAGYSPARRLLEQHQRTRMQTLRDLVEDGISRGVLRGAHSYLVAEVMMSAVARVKEPDFLEEAGMTMSQAFAEVGHLIRHGLVHREQPAAAEPPASGADSRRAPRARPEPRRRSARRRIDAQPGRPRRRDRASRAE